MLSPPLAHTRLSRSVGTGPTSPGRKVKHSPGCSQFLSAFSVILPFTVAPWQTSKEATLPHPPYCSQVPRQRQPTSRAVCSVAGTAEAQEFKKMVSDDSDEAAEWTPCCPRAGVGTTCRLLASGGIKVGKLFMVQVQAVNEHKLHTGKPGALLLCRE